MDEWTDSTADGIWNLELDELMDGGYKHYGRMDGFLVFGYCSFFPRFYPLD